MSTGEDWYKIMFDTTRSSSLSCIPGDSCGSCINIYIRCKCSIFYSFYSLCLIYDAKLVYLGFDAIV